MITKPAVYWFNGQLCQGTNVLYEIDGRPTSARLAWVASPAEAKQFIESQRRRIERQ